MDTLDQKIHILQSLINIADNSYDDLAVWLGCELREALEEKDEIEVREVQTAVLIALLYV
jgi:hypothetical protein